MNRFVTLICLLFSCGVTLYAVPRIDPNKPQPYTQTFVGTNLYTKGLGSGTLKGKLDAVHPTDLAGIFAVSREPQITIQKKIANDRERVTLGKTNEYRNVFRYSVHLADIAPDNSFTFTNLQAGTYDLVVLLAGAYYNGIVLGGRQPNTLTQSDFQDITNKIWKSNAYFNEKQIARMWGTTGYAGKAKVIVQEVRSLPILLQSAEERTDIETRSMKLYILEDVSMKGTGMWKVEETREFIRQEVGKFHDPTGLIPEYFCKKLSGIVVIDELEDIGLIRLSKDAPPK